jgi:predicted Zn-dependent peptidase
MYRVESLANGLTLATAPMPHMASVSVGLWVAVGGRHEPEPLNGVSHFIEHLLFKGTRRRSAEEISQAVEGMGGYLNAFTAEENTCFYAKARHDHFAVLLDVLTDMFLNATFAPAEIEKERGVIKEEVAMYLDQPAQHVQELLNATQWPGQALGRPLTGTEASVDALSRRDLLGYRRAHYHAANAVLAVAGQFDPAAVRAAVTRAARHFRAGRRSPFAPVACQQTAPRVCLFTKATEQTQLALGIRTCSRHDERRFALRLLNVVLGENMSSRLFQVIREDCGLAYSVYSSLSYFDDVGDLVISAGLETANLDKVLRLIVRELRRLAERPPTAAELRRARDYVIGQIDLRLEGTENQMMWLGENLLGYGRVMPPGEVKQRLLAVRAAEVRAAARDFFRPERLNLALVSPMKSARGLEEKLHRVTGR